MHSPADWRDKEVGNYKSRMECEQQVHDILRTQGWIPIQGLGINKIFANLCNNKGEEYALESG